MIIFKVIGKIMEIGADRFFLPLRLITLVVLLSIVLYKEKKGSW